MLRLLIGENPYLVRKEEEKILFLFRSENPSGSVVFFDADNADDTLHRAGIEESLEMGLFSSEKIVVIRNASKRSEVFSKDLALLLKERKNLASTSFPVILFVESGKTKKTDMLVAFLLKKAEVMSVLSELSSRELESFAKDFLTHLNPDISLAPSALRALLFEYGKNLFRLENELRKIAFLKDSGEVNEKELRELVRFSVGGTSFDALDALASGDRSRAMLLFDQELGKGEDAFKIFGSCAWQVRTLLLVRDAYDRGDRQSASIARNTGMKEFSVRKALSAVSRLSLDRLRQSMQLLSELDLQMKTGQIKPELALTLFAAKF